MLNRCSICGSLGDSCGSGGRCGGMLYRCELRLELVDLQLKRCNLRGVIRTRPGARASAFPSVLAGCLGRRSCGQLQVLYIVIQYFSVQYSSQIGDE